MTLLRHLSGRGGSVTLCVFSTLTLDLYSPSGASDQKYRCPTGQHEVADRLSKGSAKVRPDPEGESRVYKRMSKDPICRLLGELLLMRSALDRAITDFERLLGEQVNDARRIRKRDAADEVPGQLETMMARAEGIFTDEMRQLANGLKPRAEATDRARA
jgi:hypothetical protein